jgi:sporulation protein YlmC with PRC-barrel domain
MELPLNAPVECTDGICGTSIYVLINPITKELTHLVVKETKSKTEYLVPLCLVSKTDKGCIKIDCSKKDLEKMDVFCQQSFIQETVQNYEGFSGYGKGTYFYWPYVKPINLTKYRLQETEEVPHGDIVMNRGTRVEAIDGTVGRVKEFVVNPKNCHITHLVIGKGLWWRKKEIMIPVSAIMRSSRDSVLLKLSKLQVKALPVFGVTRPWS